MKSNALVLTILVVVSLILTGIRTRLIVDSGYRLQEHRAEAAKRSAAENTASAFETPAAIGGLKVTTENGWFAARPSGTEDVYKIYAESFNGEAHLKQIQTEAQKLVTAAIA